MKPEVQQLIDRAQRRAEWSALALDAAAQELLAAGEEGIPVAGTAAQLRAASADVAELVARIESDRKLTGSARRVRDGL